MVTMMIDLTVCRQDFPGRLVIKSSERLSKRVVALAGPCNEHFIADRFVPYFSTHEFEAFNFTFSGRDCTCSRPPEAGRMVTFRTDEAESVTQLTRRQHASFEFFKDIAKPSMNIGRRTSRAAKMRLHCPCLTIGSRNGESLIEPERMKTQIGVHGTPPAGSLPTPRWNLGAV